MVHPERLAARADRVSAGLEELEQWLRDQVRGGIAGLGQGGYAALERVAARMVDAQAPGVASMLRSLPGEQVGEDWPGQLLEQLGALHLLIQAHRGLDRLPADLAATVRTRVGYPVRKADVLAGPGLLDHWYAVGSVDTVELRLETRRVWLFGATSRRWAVVLSFAPIGGFLDDSVTAGQQLQARLHFYAGSGQYRALVGEQIDVVDPPMPSLVLPSAETYEDVGDRFATLLAGDPWASRMPAVVRAAPVPPARSGGSVAPPGGHRSLCRAGRPATASRGPCWPARWASRSPCSASGVRGGSSRSACCDRGLVDAGAAGAGRVMDRWEDLVTTALLGTDRRPIAEGPAATDIDPVDRVLGAAARHRAAVRAGRLLGVLSAPGAAARAGARAGPGTGPGPDRGASRRSRRRPDQCVARPCRGAGPGPGG